MMQAERQNNAGVKIDDLPVLDHPRRVVHMTSAHPPFDIRIFYKECVSLAEAGFEVILVAGNAADQTCSGVRLVNVSRSKGRLHRMTVGSWKVFRAALRQKSLLYHIHDPELLVWSRILLMLRKKVIFDMHENLPLSITTKPWIPKVLRPILSTTTRLIERSSLVGVSVIFAESSYVKYYSWVRHKAVVLNMPLLDELSHIREEKNDSPSVGYLGGVDESKGCMQILSALDILNQQGVAVRWECIGRIDNAWATKMLRFAESHDLKQVNLLGVVPPPVGWRMMARCHIGIAVLAPEPNYFESYPTKIFEYMALGIPVIASNFPLYRAIVEKEGCGMCVDPLRPEEIAHAILYILRNPDVATKMGEAGQHAVRKKYNWRIEEAKLVNFYRDILSTNTITSK